MDIQERDRLRSKIMELESVMKTQYQDSLVDLPVTHYHIPGVYIRELVIPKDFLLTGMIHKTEHFCILSKGKVAVYTDHGMKILEAPKTIKCSPGSKRVLYALEEAVWSNVHHNPENIQDPKVIIDYYTVETFDQLGQDIRKEIE